MWTKRKNHMKSEKIIKKSTISLFSLMGAAGATLYFIAFVVLHILDRNISPITDYVSEYAIGPYGEFFRITLLIHGFGNIFTSFAMAYYFRRFRAGVFGAVLFGISSLGIILGAIFSMDPPGGIRSIAGTIHQIVALGSFGVEIVALIFLGYVFKKMPVWKSFGIVTRIIVIINVILLSWLIFSIATEGLLGIAERGAMLAFLIWEFLVALHLRNLNKKTDEVDMEIQGRQRIG